MKKILLSLVVASTLIFAGQGDYKSELSLTVGGVKPEGNLDLENQLNLGLRFGVYVEDKIFDMVEAGFERASSVDYKNSNEDTNINRFFVNVIKEYDLSKETALYGLVGMGYENYRNPQFENDDDGFVQYGVGVKQWLTDTFALKAEVRHGITFGGDNNLFYNVGFVIPFGKKVKEEMPIKSEPIVVVNKPESAVEAEQKSVVEQAPRDDDNDGVINKKDACLSTPAGRVVNANGCMKVITLRVNFGFDKATIPNSYDSLLNETADFMQANRAYKVELQGHTDSKGTVAYNQALSERRALAAKNALSALGVNKDRISTIGYGESKPVASNKTEEGRAENRRVEASFSK